jgi:hypothetical protein
MPMLGIFLTFTSNNNHRSSHKPLYLYHSDNAMQLVRSCISEKNNISVSCISSSRAIQHKTLYQIVLFFLH